MKKAFVVIMGVLFLCVSNIYGQEEKERQLKEAQKRIQLAEIEYYKKMVELEMQQKQLQNDILMGKNTKEAFRQQAMLAKMQEQIRQYRQALGLYNAFTEENEKQGLAFLKEHAQSYYDDIIGLKPDDFDNYKKQIVAALQQQWSIQKRAGSDEEYLNLLLDTYSLELHAKQLVKEFKSSPEKKHNVQLKNELRNNLEQLFELREKEREREVVKLEEKLSALRENLRLRKRNKKLIVDNRLKQLTGEASTLEW